MNKLEPETTTFVDRMQLELVQLDDKIAKAVAFTKLDTFTKLLTPLEQQLLYIQISTMSTYGATLSARISLAKGKEDV